MCEACLGVVYNALQLPVDVANGRIIDSLVTSDERVQKNTLKNVVMPPRFTPFVTQTHHTTHETSHETFET